MDESRKRTLNDFAKSEFGKDEENSDLSPDYARELPDLTPPASFNERPCEPPPREELIQCLDTNYKPTKDAGEIVKWLGEGWREVGSFFDTIPRPAQNVSALCIDGIARLSLSSDLSKPVLQNTVISQAERLHAAILNPFLKEGVKFVPVPIQIHEQVFNIANRSRLTEIQKMPNALTLNAILMDYVTNDKPCLCSFCSTKQAKNPKFRQVNINGAITESNYIKVIGISINCAGERTVEDGPVSLIFFLEGPNKEKFQYITVPFYFKHQRQMKKVHVVAPPNKIMLSKAVILSSRFQRNCLDMLDKRMKDLISNVNESFMNTHDIRTMLNWFHMDAISIDMKLGLTSPLLTDFYVVCQAAAYSVDDLVFKYHELKIDGDLNDYAVVNVYYTYTAKWTKPLGEALPQSDADKDILVIMSSGAVFRKGKVEKVWGNFDCRNPSWALALGTVGVQLSIQRQERTKRALPPNQRPPPQFVLEENDS